MVTEASPRLTLDDVLVVDADVHAHEQPDQIVQYTDPPWREAVANVARVPHRYLSIPGWSTSPPFYLPGSSLPTARGKVREEIVWNAAQMRRELDALSIDVGVLFPDHFLKIAALPNPDYAAALARAYHRWLAERWLSEPNDLYGVVMAVPQDPADAAREVARAARDRRFVG